MPRSDIYRANHLVTFVVMRCTLADVRLVLGFHKHKSLISKLYQDVRFGWPLPTRSTWWWGELRPENHLGGRSRIQKLR